MAGRHHAPVLAGIALLMLAVPSFSEERGFSIAVGAGIGTPVGTVSETLPKLRIDEVLPFTFPLLLEVGYRAGSHWSFEAGLQFGPGTEGAFCPAQLQCRSSYSAVFLGTRRHFRFESWVPDSWIGLTIGAAQLQQFAAPGYRNLEMVSTWSGLPNVGLRVGSDLTVKEALTLSPWVMVQSGVFQRHAVESPRGHASESLRQPTVHAVVSVGVRVELPLYTRAPARVRPEFERPHPAALRYDAAVRELDGVEKLQRAGRVGIVGQRLDRAQRLLEQARRDLDEGTDLREEYATVTGNLTHEALVREIDALCARIETLRLAD